MQKNPILSENYQLLSEMLGLNYHMEPSLINLLKAKFMVNYHDLSTVAHLGPVMMIDKSSCLQFW